jgi:serine/alanine adding enzyme
VLNVEVQTAPELWNAYLKKVKLDHFAHCWEWREIIEGTFKHKPYYLAAFQGDEIEGILPLFFVKSPLFGNSLISVPYLNSGGIVASSEIAFSSLVAKADELKTSLKVSYVEFRGRHAEKGYVSPKGFPLPVRTHKVAMRMGLPNSGEELMASFDKKLRAQVKRPEKAGVTAQTTSGASANISDFYKVFSKNMRDLGTPVYPRKFFELIFEQFETARCIVCYLDKTPIAAGVTIGFQDSVEIPCASSLREHNATSANMLLYRTAMEEGIKSGYKFFDFGRSSPDSGTFKFKEQWGALPQTLHWYYLANPTDVPDVNPKSPKFSLFVGAWKMLPLPVANTLGPFLTRGLP